MCYLNCKEASQAGPEGLTEQNMTEVQKVALVRPSKYVSFTNFSL